jgi:hypothetical protein
VGDDIVTRLREQTERSNTDRDAAYRLIMLSREAADEIERLRTMGNLLVSVMRQSETDFIDTDAWETAIEMWMTWQSGKQ